MAYTKLETAIAKLSTENYTSKNFDNFRDNVEWVSESLKTQGIGVFNYHKSKELLKNEDNVKHFVSISGNCLRISPYEIRGNKEIALIAIKSSEYMLLDVLSDELRCDKEVVLPAVTKCGNNLKFASEELKCDKEVVLAALRNTPYVKGDMSLGLQVLCKDKDPIITIEAEILKEQLKPKKEEKQQKRFKL